MSEESKSQDSRKQAPKKPDARVKSDERQERLAEALRQNLRRRKAPKPAPEEKE